MKLAALVVIIVGLPAAHNLFTAMAVLTVAGVLAVWGRVRELGR